MRIHRFISKILDENVYLCIGSEAALLIDPGDTAALEFIQENNIDLTHILLTHGHYDHLAGAEAISKATGATILAHGDERQTLAEPGRNMSQLFGIECSLALPDEAFFSEGDDICGMFTVVHTPGHTPGCCCYYAAAEGILFSGDTLFRGIVGRTDLPGSSTQALRVSVRDKLMKLPPSVTVYPGHGEATTIREEHYKRG